jgi:sulfiredoxin
MTWVKTGQVFHLDRRAGGAAMMKKEQIPIAKVRVPVKRMKTLEPDKVATLAEDILENGQTTPVRLRADGQGFVLIEGLHRLEAMKALGEVEIEAYLVQARLH